MLRKSRTQQSHDAALWTRFRRGHLGRAGDILSPRERQGMFGVQSGGERGKEGGWGVQQRLLVTLQGKQLMVAVKGSAARTGYRCSPNKAFIARLCVHDPRESQVTAVPAASKGSQPHSMPFELDQGVLRHVSANLRRAGQTARQESFWPRPHQ